MIDLTYMRRRRHSFTKSDRKAIFDKTLGHCHICGKKPSYWVADHIKPHASGGEHAVHNYMPACPECNRLRWFYEPWELKYILELGVYLQKEVEKGTELGKQVKNLYRMRKRRNRKRRNSK